MVIRAKAGFAREMADGQAGLKAKKFAQAAKHFEAALKLFPNDPDAAKLLKDAQDAAPKKKP